MLQERGVSLPKSLKVLFINIGESRHGSTYRARKLCELLQYQGHSVYYVESNYKTTENTCSIPQTDSVLGYLLATAKRVVICLKRDFDILFLQKPWLLNLPCLVVAKLKGKKIVLDFDDLDSRWQSTRFKAAMASIGERWMPKYVDSVTTHNRYLQNYIIHLNSVKASLVPQGVDTRLFDPQKYDKAFEKKRLGLEGKTICCFLGSFTIGSAKDLHVILRAITYVTGQREDIFFLMIGGSGPLEEKYLQFIRELKLNRVLVTGSMPQSEVPRYLAAADIGLLYMDDDHANRMRMSLKLLEYLAMELTVVGHVVGSSRDIFGEYCFLCEPSVMSLSERILEVVQHDLKGQSARAFIQSHYDWQVVGQALASVMRTIIQ